MTKTFLCDAAISDLVLNAARAAIPPNADTYHLNAGIKNNPQLILLVALLDASKAVAAAVADNAWDDCQPIPADVFRILDRLTRHILNDVEAAAQCPDQQEWSLPSCSSKELV
jgi:hypothetical protein